MTAIALARFERSIDVPSRFFEEHADAISRACLEMARRFERGGRLLAFGVGAQATDARHVAVEFAHPVLVGKRALPAIPVSAEPVRGAEPFVELLRVLGRSDDMAMAITAGGGAEVGAALHVARESGMLTIALAGPAAAHPPVDILFAVPTDDAFVVQEVHELIYHVLWELVHVFLEHREAR